MLHATQVHRDFCTYSLLFDWLNWVNIVAHTGLTSSWRPFRILYIQGHQNPEVSPPPPVTYTVTWTHIKSYNVVWPLFSPFVFWFHMSVLLHSIKSAETRRNCFHTSGWGLSWKIRRFSEWLNEIAGIDILFNRFWFFYAIHIRWRFKPGGK